MSRSSRQGRLGWRSGGGFTLLEVLAAVAILGMLFTVLAGVAVTGLRAEGTNLRRVRASLVADNVLSELEAQMLAGVYPEESSRESEHEESGIQFTVQVDVKPLADEVGGGGGADMVAFLNDEVPDLMPLLRAVEVRVSWQDADDEHSVYRQTYLFDQSQWAPGLTDMEMPGGLSDALPEQESP